MVPDRDGDDVPQADVQHDRRRDHAIRMLVGQVEKARQVEGALGADVESDLVSAPHRHRRSRVDGCHAAVPGGRLVSLRADRLF